MYETMQQQQQIAVPDVSVVIVDDDDAVRDSLKFSLEIEGFAVRTYAQPQQLLSEADMPACDCLVVDQNMPGMSGLDLIDRLRSRKFLAPAILITSHPHSDVRARAASAGVAIVEKPLLSGVLLDSIRQVTS